MSDEFISDILVSIRDSLETIEKRAGEIKKPDDFISSDTGREKLDSIAMRLQHVGESLKKLHVKHPELFKDFPEIEWTEIIQFRDFVSHHYELLNHEIVFNIVKKTSRN